ncbi:MAG: hypothetical protein KDA65_08135 [Planctomycetaceae bacterium]|nr:hypothetical protein [Planctomycetaceae bacterium]
MSATSQLRPLPSRSKRIEAGCMDLIQVILIWISFLGYSFTQAPVPAVNEPHYLTKAYHYWNPEWCEGDLFLESANAHLVFYQTFGVLTECCSFQAAAVIGRLIAYLLLAVGWCFCLRPLFINRWGPLLASWIFLTVSVIGNFSGEWVIGGIESKVVAYGFLLFALGHLLRQEFCRCGVHAGLAVAFHPVVGGWGIIALAGAAMWGYFRGLNSLPWKRILVATGLMLLFAAPGLIPALLLIGGGDPRADYLQVYFRLGHHLDPMQFPQFAWLYYAALILAWLGLRLTVPRLRVEALFTRFILVTLLLALVGLLIGFRLGTAEEMWWSGLRTGLLKFYFFRLMDIFIPVGVGVSLTRCLLDRYTKSASSDFPFPRRLQDVVNLSIFLATLLFPYFKDGYNPSRMNPQRKQGWLDVCEWIRTNTPEETLFVTPRHTWAFTWYTGRSEYFAFKNMPQDAPSLLTWYDRYQEQQAWWDKISQASAGEVEKWPRQIPVEMIAEVKAKTNANYWVLHNSSVLPQKPIYQNKIYSVYLLNVQLESLDP